MADIGGNPSTCPDCGARRDTAEFMRTDTGLEVPEDSRELREFLAFQ